MPPRPHDPKECGRHREQDSAGDTDAFPCRGASPQPQGAQRCGPGQSVLWELRPYVPRRFSQKLQIQIFCVKILVFKMVSIIAYLAVASVLPNKTEGSVQEDTVLVTMTECGAGL